MEELYLKTNDNIKIAINHYFNQKCADKESVIILVHGWFMCKDSKPFAQLAQALSQHFDIISMDCRGHGKSSGRYTFTVDEEKDLNAVIEYAKQSYKNIFLIGFSLGAALVLLHGAKDSSVKAITAVSAPSCFEKIENHFWHPHAWIPTLKKCEPATWMSIRPDFYKLLLKSKTAPISIIEKLKMPVLFVAGENDPTVFPWHTQELFKHAKCPKSFKKIKGGLHAEDLFLQDKEAFVKLCCEWVYSALQQV